MGTNTRETRGHTNREGTLNISVNVGISDADVEVVLHVREAPVPGTLDPNGWPVDYFERIVGSMPDLQRAPQGSFEERLALD